jgi:DNA-binding NarL/FixJ family response regulator
MHKLSPKQLEQASLVSKGLTDKEIANIMHLCLGTIKNNNKLMYRKMDLKAGDGNRVKLARWYWETYEKGPK